VLRCPKQYFLSTFATTHAPARAEFFLRVMRANLELKHVIAHPRAIQYFRVDLRKQYSEENLSCYELFERYHNEYEERPATEDNAAFLKRMHNDAQYVVMTYVKQGAKKAVNIKSKQSEPVLQLVERASKAVAQLDIGKTVEPEEMRILLDKLPVIFDEAQLEVYQLMNRDSFGKFQKSALYKEMLKDIGSYSDQEINGSAAIRMVADDARRFWRTSIHLDACSDRENVETVYSRIKLKEECQIEGASSMASRLNNADVPTQWWDNTVIMPTFRNH